MLILSLVSLSSILAVSLQEKIAAFDSCTFTKKFFVTSKKNDRKKSDTASSDPWFTRTSVARQQQDKLT